MGMLWLLTLYLSTCLSHALNLDELSPTVVRSGVLDEGIGFGWSMAQHRLSNNTNIVLISAPRGDGTFAVNEGVIYMCPFDINQQCQENYNFGRNYSSWPFVSSPPSTPSFLQGQLLGYSVRSFGDRVLVSAPYQRFTETIGVRNIDGNVLSLDRDLDPASAVNFFNVPITNIPTETLSFTAIGIDTGLMQESGTGRLLLQNFYSNDNVGSSDPGETLLLSLSGSGLGPEVVAQGVVGVNEGIQPYTGYHIETGHFTTLPGSGEAQAVMSSPRGSSHMGYVDVLRLQSSSFVRVVQIFGDEVDGYFGYDVAVVDFKQASGYESLVVGCPLCSTDTGRVYIYLHTGNPSAPFDASTPSQVIDSSSFVRGRFGIGVEAIGDIDQDGFEDVAISAPYHEDGRVYVYRGSATGLVTDLYQTISPSYPAKAFGFSLSGGLDIDNNGYPDLTVGDLSSRTITTIRGSPLVNITTSLDGDTRLDIVGESSRSCPYNGTMLHCFNVTPCFFYNTEIGDVSRFAFKYNLSADLTLRRVGIYQNGQVSSRNSVLRNETIAGAGEVNRQCGDTVTFALFDNLRDPASIQVSIMLEDGDEPIALEEVPSLAKFGKPLHPKLRRYESGNQLARTRFDYYVMPNINCTSGDPTKCEGVLVSTGTVNLTDSNVEGGDKLVLARDNTFTLDVSVVNTGMDTSISSVLDILVPDQIILSDATSVSSGCNVRKENGSLIECPLKDAIVTGGSSSLSVSFTFNDTLTFLETGSFNVSLMARDGGSSRVFSPQVLTIELEAIGEYMLVSSVAQQEYASYRSVRTIADPSGIILDQIGPLVTYLTLIQNSKSGTTFPRSTVTIYLPTDMKMADSDRYTPLLIPTSIVVGAGVDSVNCSHYESFSQFLLSNQRPVNYIPEWQGTPPAANPDCEEGGRFRCGAILCTIFNLQPLPSPPSQINVFTRLYSPVVEEEFKVSVFASISKDTALPKLSAGSVNSSSAEFSVVPGPRDVPRTCINYWVVVVSVVIGIFTLLVLIVICAFLGVFRRWYKGRRQDDMTGEEQTDNEYSYHRRTIPQISSVPATTNGTSTPPTPSAEVAGRQPPKKVDSLAMTEKEMEKEAEAERELEDMFSASELADGKATRKSTTSSITFDPSMGLDYGSGQETEI